MASRDAPRRSARPSIASNRTEPLQPHAGVGRAALGVTLEELVDHGLAEALAEVEREVRNAHPVRERAGAGHRLRRAAALLAVGGGIRPQLERHGHHVLAGVEGQLAAAALSTPPLMATSVRRAFAREPSRAVARGHPERSVKRVGRELATRGWLPG